MPKGIKDATVDHEFFNNWNKESAYLVGLIAADGCLYKRKDVDTYELHYCCTDFEIVQIIRSKLKLSNPINQRAGRNIHNLPQYEISVCSQKIGNKLIENGITPNKSLTLKWTHSCPDNLLHHLIRGFLDGDGCIGIYPNPKGKTKKAQINFIGTHHFLTHISQSINRIIKVKEKIPTKKSNCELYQLQYTSLKEVKQILNWLYEDSKNIRLTRKYKIYQNIVKLDYSNKNPYPGITKTKHNTWQVRVDDKYVGVFETLEKAIIAQKISKETGKKFLKHPIFSAFGEEKTLQQWSEDPRCVVNKGTLWYRLRKTNISIEEAMTKPKLK